MRQLSRALLVAAALAIASIGAASHSTGGLDVEIVNAPIAPDGTTSGAASDFVLTFKDKDPALPGLALKNGAVIEVVLPDDFVNSGAGGDVVVLLQGWPQSPRAPFPWTTSIVGNTITLTLTDDWMPGAFGPGVKQVHLILFGFTNPRAGRYPVELTIQPDPASYDTLHGVGRVKIIPRARPSVNTVSLFSGPPGPPPPFFNPIYQNVALGGIARQVGLYLWGRDSAPALDIDLWMTNRSHGRLLDVDTGRTVGQVWIQAPHSARNYALTTMGPSTQVSAFVTGVPVGLLLVQFMPDPTVAGDYVIRIRMNGGNQETLFVSVE